MNLPSFRSIVFAAATVIVSAATPLFAQTAVSSLVTNRLTAPVNENARVTLKGTVDPKATAANDHGAAPDNMALNRMQIVLKRSDAQESALKQLISDMHAPGGASYHKWLTPDQFGAQFGASDQDIAVIEAWLQSKGFSVTRVNPGKQTLEFSGNVAQLRTAFHTQIHQYLVNGQTHFANSTDPQIPSALAPVLGGFTSLNNFRGERYAKVLGKAKYNPTTDKAAPEWTVGQNGVSFVLAPGDFDVQYDLPATSTGVTGTGQTIAIVNDANINVGVVNSYRTLFGLPVNPPQVIIDGNDPGVDGINDLNGPNGDSIEAYLDVEEAGAVAPTATVDLVIAADTELQYGLFLAAEHAVYGNIAPVVSMSFGLCEKDSPELTQAFGALWEQAAAQGITVMVSSGDGGSATCDRGTDYAIYGQAVNGWGSSAYNVSVGGTDFYYSSYNSTSAAIEAQLATYWNTTASNSSPTVSIKKVIPEQPWNDSQYGLDIYNENSSSGTTTAGGGGGSSNCVTLDTSGACEAGYPKPAWQTGTGVPADSARDLPDVSLFAANGDNYSYYPLCAEDADCQPVSSGNEVQITGVGGTSASTPAFAGIMALVNQKYGRQGQADFILYPLAAQYPAAFHDVINGTNTVPCNVSSAPVDCIAVSDPITVNDPSYGPATEGEIGTGTTAEYGAGVGYDLASGLGTVDASVLINDWTKVAFTGTTTTLTASSTSFTHGTAITLSGAVTPASGTATGDVALMTDSSEPVQQGQLFFTLSSDAYSGSVSTLPGGTYDIWAQYGGDSKNGLSTSPKTQITVAPEPSSIYFNAFSPAGSLSSGSSVDYGTQMELSAQVAPSSELTALENCQTIANTACPAFGDATGPVVFTDNSTNIHTAVLNVGGDAEYNAPFALGAHSVSASYAGDNSYSKATAPSPVTFTVVQDVPVIYFGQTSASSSAATSGAVTVYVNVENAAMVNNSYPSQGYFYPSPVAAPTGTVSITGLPAGVTGTTTLAAGVDPYYQAVEGLGQIAIPASTAPGSYTVTVAYSGDTNYKNESVTGYIVVAAPSSSLKTSTTTGSITGSISPTTFVTVSGTVTGQTGSAAPTGGILVYSAGNYLGEAGFTGSSADASFFAFSLNSQSIYQGSNVITLQYTGDSVYNPSASTLSNIANSLADFSLVPNSTIVAVPASGSATDVINLGSSNGFAGTVRLNCAATGGVLCSLSSIAPTLAAGQSTAVTLTVTNAAVATAGSAYDVLITGTDATGKYVHTAGIRVIAPATTTPAGLALTAATPSVTLAQPGGSATDLLTVTPAGAFSGGVSFSCVVSSGSGSAAGFTCNAGAITITPGMSATSTLTIASTTATAPGSYTATVTAMDSATGKITSSATIAVTVNALPSIALTAAISTLTIAPNANATDLLTVTPANGFTGGVSFSCAMSASSGSATGLTCSAGTITIAAGTPGTSTLTVASTTAAVAGSYTATVTATDTATGKVTATVTVAVTVSVPSFTIAGPASAIVITAPGQSGTGTMSVTASGDFSGTVNFTCVVASAPTGATAPTCSGSATVASGATSGSGTLTVATTALSTSALNVRPNKLFAVGGGIAIAGLLLFGIPARRRSWRTILMLFIALAVMGIGVGCGGSSKSGGGTTTGTTAGSYSLTVTGTSGSLTAAPVTVSVTVN